MGTFSLWHWIIVCAYLALLIVPFWRLLPKFGLPSWLAILAPFPLISVLYLWILAFRDRVR